MVKREIYSPIPYTGGKGNLVSKLLKYVPKHKYYIEPFGGSAELLFAKKPAEFEVYNDKWSIIVNFFRVLRDKKKFEEFYRKVIFTPYSREEYNNSKQILKSYMKGEIQLTDVDLAYHLFINLRQSFAGRLFGSWGYCVTNIRRKMPNTVSKYLFAIENLPEIHERLIRVQIENLDWKDCLEKYSGYDFNEEFIYLDPPYLPETRRSKKDYICEMSYEDHEELIEYLIAEERRVMLSGYDNKLYEKLEKHGFKKIKWNVGCNAVGRTRQTGLLGEGVTFEKNQRREECIWINYELHIPLTKYF